MNLILTSYFTGSDNPMFGANKKGLHRIQQHSPDQFALMESWYRSVERHGLSAVVLHDELSDAFVEKYSTDQISFLRTPLQHPHLSINEERFILWRKFLLEKGDVEYALLTDLFDVHFLRDPFPFMEEHPESGLFTGDIQGKLLSDRKGKYTYTQIVKLFDDFPYWDNPKLGAGTVGGSRENLLKLLGGMEQLFLHFRQPRTDMAVFNYCAYSLFGGRIFCGPPFNSPFGGYVTGGDFIVVHK